MSIATFLFLRTGRNIFKPQVKADITQIDSPKVVAISSMSDSGEIHVGPRGGKYRFDAHGRKVYLKSA